MPKCLPCHKFFQVKLHSLAFWILWLVGIIVLLFYHGTYNYEALKKSEVESLLYREVNSNLVLHRLKPDCKYDILSSTITVDPSEIHKHNGNFSTNGIANGSYSPDSCNPLFSVALLVTYRNRQSHLDIFVPYIHNFLRKQNIHYKIYLIEQQDENSWNKGALYNIGARAALADGFPCLVLHDVDLFPLDTANLYACAHQPRHLSASIDKFRYVLPYSNLIGGVCAIRSVHFTRINGFSNRYIGWGGEDDDLALRIKRHGLRLIRFPREMSRYTMLLHRQAMRNSRRMRLLTESAHASHHAADGLTTVSAHMRSSRIVHHRLFTLLAVHFF